MSRLIMSDQRLFLQEKWIRRDKLVILSHILCRAAKGVCRTKLMYKVGLSSAQMGKYIPVLVRADLLEVSMHSKKAVYLTTERGREFLDIFDTLLRLLD